MIYMYATMLLVLSIPHQTHAAFTIFPSSQVVGVGQQAVFRCQNPNAEFLSWRVNETQVNFLNSHPDPNIIISTTMDESNNVVFILRITAQLEYNETVIICTAFSIVGDSNSTTPVKLLIQGPLSMVTEIKRNSSNISWEVPFSLNLTGVDPDIVYCVEVYNITCGVDDLVVGDCDVTEPHFIDNRLQQGNVYRITITPRSNGQDAQNGTSNTIEDTSSTNVSIIQPLSRTRLWNYQVLALDCSENPVTSVLELSTHDIQSVTVSSPSPGLIRVTGDFISGSSATSVLITIYSTDNRNDVYYTISSLSTEGETLVTNISSLPSGQYNVSVFVLEENDRPFNRSASTPRSVLVGENQGGENGNFLIEYDVLSTSTGVCINCTFLDSSATGCVAVVHQRISQLSSSGLMNIESSYKFTRSGDTAYGCIEGVNLEQYQVGVIGSQRKMKKATPNISTDCNWCIQVGIFIAGVVLGVILTLIPMIIIIIFIKKDVTRAHVDASKEEHIEMQDCGAYEVTKPLRQPQPRSLDMDDNPAYGVHQ